MASEQTILKLVNILSAAYPRHPVTPATTELYVMMLADIPDGTLVQAVKVTIATCKFFPTVAEIFDAIRLMETHATEHPTPAVAWGMVLAEINGPNYPSSPDNIPNPIVAKVARSMGWLAIRMSENEMADRAHFMKLYEIEIKRANEYRQLDLMPGGMAETKSAIAAGVNDLTLKLQSPEERQ